MEEKAPYEIKQFPGTEDEPIPLNEKLLAEGKVLQKIQTEFATAISVQRPRQIDLIQKNVLREAEFAGKDFFYSWVVKSKKGGPKTIQGPSIGLAMSLAREWTNCAVDVQVDPGPVYDIFIASFVDIEKGFTVKRAFKQKRSIAPGKYDEDRWADMEFQKAQSKAIRNVVCSGVPKWLINQAIEKAKESELEKISKSGIDKASKEAIEYFERYGVTEEQIIQTMGKPRNEWTTDDILTLRGFATEIKDGDASPGEIFKSVKTDDNTPLKSETFENDQVFYDAFKNLRSQKGVLDFEKKYADQLKNASEDIKIKWNEKFEQQVNQKYEVWLKEQNDLQGATKEPDDKTEADTGEGKGEEKKEPLSTSEEISKGILDRHEQEKLGKENKKEDVFFILCPDDKKEHALAFCKIRCWKRNECPAYQDYLKESQ